MRTLALRGRGNGCPQSCRGGRLLAVSAAALCLGCGYGFGNRDFADAQSTAIAYAQALQAGDTARMRQLSWGTIQTGIPVLLREMPPAYTQFATPTPQLVTIHGGGIYGGSNEFLVESKQLASCRGGIRVMVLTQKNTARVASIHLVPPLDSVSDDACRKEINGTS